MDGGWGFLCPGQNYQAAGTGTPIGSVPVVASVVVVLAMAVGHHRGSCSPSVFRKAWPSPPPPPRLADRTSNTPMRRSYPLCRCPDVGGVLPRSFSFFWRRGELTLARWPSPAFVEGLPHVPPALPPSCSSSNAPGLLPGGLVSGLSMLVWMSSVVSEGALTARRCPPPLPSLSQVHHCQ